MPSGWHAAGPSDGGGESKSKRGGGFESMGLSQPVYKAIIRKGYRVPTPIQRKVIDLVKGGRDVVAMARTGSGKTAAFLVPMLEQLQEHSANVGARGVVLTPTRELAMQTLKFARELGCFTNLRVCLLIGGESLDDQFAALSANPDIIIATPGRLQHHLAQTDMTLSRVQLCVFDEADRLFEMGFADQIKEILKGMPEEKQTCLFSATLPQILADFTSAGLHDPELVRLDVETKISDTLKVTFFTVRSEQKDGAMLAVRNLAASHCREMIKQPRCYLCLAQCNGEQLESDQLISPATADARLHSTIGATTSPTLREISQCARCVKVIREFIEVSSQQTIIFAATKHHVEFIGNILSKAGYSAALVYGDLDPAARKTSIGKFRANKCQFLVVTDIAARGIDIPLLDNVINYDFPMTPKLFVHRVGRAARAGRNGTAFSFVAYDEMPYMLDVHLFLGRPPCNVVPEGESLDESSTVVYGTFAPDVIDSECESVRNWVNGDSWLQSQSSKRFKELPPPGLHPWFQQRVGSVEAQRTDMVNALKTFRPHTEIFRMRAKNSTGRAGTIRLDQRKPAGLSRPVGTVDAVEEQIIQDTSSVTAPVPNAAAGKVSKRRRKKAQAAAAAASGIGSIPARVSSRDTARDEEFFIGVDDSDSHGFSEESLRVRGNSDSNDNRSAIEDAVLTLTSDEAGDLVRNNRSMMRWDSRKMKYVEANSLNDRSRTKNEAGVMVNRKDEKLGKESMYQAWVQKTNQRIPKPGTMESETAERDMNRAANFVVGGKHVGKRRGRGGRMYGGESDNTKVPNAKTKPELRPAAQIAKERHKKAKIKGRLKALQNKKRRK